MSVLKKIFPFIEWFEQINGATIRADFLAGVTVALVLIPQSMAYAQLAGLPPYYGLYAAFLPPVVASLFGSSRQLATGPVAVVSLMTAAALEPLASTGSQEYIAYAILLALLVGVFQFMLGILKLGLVVNFLSHPVVNGFTNAAALIIATSQLSKVFGVDVDKGTRHYETVYRVVASALEYTHWPTLGMALLSFAIMIGLRRLNPRIPNVLAAVVVTTFISWATDFEEDATVRLEQIRSNDVKELVAKFNAAVTERKAIERFRARLNKKNVAPGKARNICASCHEHGRVEQFESDANAKSADSILVAWLHNRVGLLDKRIAELKKQESETRTALRSMYFTATKIDGDMVLYPEGHELAGSVTDGKRWRLKIGSQYVDENAVKVKSGGAVVGDIPSGLPEFMFPRLDGSIVMHLFPVAMIISLLGFMEAISIAKAMAARTHQRLDPNQELIGQGLSNIVGSMSQSYAVSGSFSRSAVNLQAGAVTGLSNVFSSLVVVVTLLFFTRLLYYLPQAVLASIIMMAVVGLLNVRGFVHAWEAVPFDGITAVVSFVATLLFAPHLEWGIALGVAMSLGAYMYRTMRPYVAELSLHPDGSLRDASRHGLRQCRHIAAIRFDGPLNFANTSYLEDEVLAKIAEMPDLKYVLIAAHGINEIDASGEEMLDKLITRLRESGYKVCFSGIKEGVLDVLKRTHLYEKIGPENLYPTQLSAIKAIYTSAHVGSDERNCPLLPESPAFSDKA